MKYWRGYLTAAILAAATWSLREFAAGHTALVDLIYPYVTRIFHIKRHRIFVDPDFVHNRTEIKFDVTVTVTLGKFLFAALAFWRSFKRNKRIYCKPQPKTEEITVSGTAASETQSTAAE